MRKLFLLLFFIINTTQQQASDCEYFVLPKLGINHYQSCLQTPEVYSDYFVYYTVTFLDGNELIETVSVRSGESAIEPTAPTKVGYQFIGWSKSIDNITSDMTVYAMYNSINYTVTYIDYNGQVLKQDDVLPGEDSVPPLVERVGYSLVGWSGSFENITSNRTLIAQYEPIYYTVRFYDGDVLLKEEIVRYYYSATAPVPPEKLGMSFVGWSNDFTNVLSSLNIYAEYNYNTFTVTFKSDDVLKIEEVRYGMSATPPEVNKDGYDFIGWMQDYSEIKADIVVQALFEIKSFLVQFVHNGEVLKQEIVEYLGSSEPPEISLEGQTLLGWDGNYNDITSDLTLQPIFSVNKYSVRYVDYDGQVVFIEEVEYGNDCSQYTPKREGYEFTGYNQPCVDIKEDTVISLLYIPKVYNVNFLFEDMIIESHLVAYGECVTQPVFQMQGYELKGWSHDLCDINSDLDITPLLEPVSYSVTFKDYNGTTIVQKEVPYNETAIISPPSREGYDFVGWSDSLIIKHDITLIAKYERKTFVIDYEYDGELLKREYVKYGQSATPPQFNIDGFTTKGWSEKLDYVKSNMKVYPILERIVYKITYVDYNGSIIAEEKVAHGDDGSPPSVKREGFDFVGWSHDYTHIVQNNTLIAQYQPKLFAVRLFVDDILLDTLLVEYGKKPIFPDGYTFDSVYVFKDIDLQGIKDKCFVDYYTDTFLGTYLCNEEIEAPIKEGYDFVSWETVDSGLRAIYRRQEFVVRFIYDGEVNEQRVGYGEDATPPLNNVKWDLSYKNITSNVDINGYIMPNDAPGLEVVDNSPYYELYFDEDISLFEISHFVIDGEIRSVQSVLFETDEVSRFDKKKNWINITLEPGEVLEEVVFEKDYFYKYEIEEYRVERSFLEKIIHWIKSIFS